MPVLSCCPLLIPLAARVFTDKGLIDHIDAAQTMVGKYAYMASSLKLKKSAMSESGDLGRRDRPWHV
jgi:hypothetical protein